MSFLPKLAICFNVILDGPLIWSLDLLYNQRIVIFVISSRVITQTHTTKQVDDAS